MKVVAIGAPILLGLFVANSVWGAPQVSLERLMSGANTEAPICAFDRDGDGLDNALEGGQHTAVDLVDTDGDEWNDAEELARGSLATAYCSQPSESSASLGGRAYMREGRLHTALGVYLRNGSLANVKLDFGIYAAHRMVLLAPSSYSQRMTVATVPTHNTGELLLVVDVVLPNSPLIRTGSMSIWAILTIGDHVTSATAINLMMRDDTPTELIHPNQLAPDGEALLGPGLLYRPLGGTVPPIQWSSGEICFQRLTPVGTHGAVVTQEVSSASCVSGWDGYCDGSSCSSSVGTTVDLIDPSALVGG